MTSTALPNLYTSRGDSCSLGARVSVRHYVRCVRRLLGHEIPFLAAPPNNGSPTDQEGVCMRRDASLSRLNAVVHYRFNGDTGRVLGERVGMAVVDEMRLDGMHR